MKITRPFFVSAVLVWVLVSAGTATAQSPQMGAQLQQLGMSMAPGQAPASQVFSGFSNEGVENPFMVPLEMSRCYTFIGTVGPGVQQLSIYLFDPSGKTVAKDTSDRSVAPKIVHCTRWPGLYKILGKIKRGAGEFGMQAFTPGGAMVQQQAPPPPPPVAVAAPPVGYVAAPPPVNSQLAGQLLSLAQTLAVGQVPATVVYGGFAPTNQEMPFMVALNAGRCYTFIGTVGMGVEQLSIYLVDPTGKTVVKDTADRSVAPRMTHCTAFPGMYKILAKIKRGAGEFAVQGFLPTG